MPSYVILAKHQVGIAAAFSDSEHMTPYYFTILRRLIIFFGVNVPITHIVSGRSISSSYIVKRFIERLRKESSDVNIANILDNFSLFILSNFTDYKKVKVDNVDMEFSDSFEAFKRTANVCFAGFDNQNIPHLIDIRREHGNINNYLSMYSPNAEHPLVILCDNHSFYNSIYEIKKSLRNRLKKINDGLELVNIAAEIVKKKRDYLRYNYPYLNEGPIDRVFLGYSYQDVMVREKTRKQPQPRDILDFFKFLLHWIVGSLILGFFTSYFFCQHNQCIECPTPPFDLNDFNDTISSLTDPATNCTYRNAGSELPIFNKVQPYKCPPEYSPSFFKAFLVYSGVYIGVLPALVLLFLGKFICTMLYKKIFFISYKKLNNINLKKIANSSIIDYVADGTFFILSLFSLVFPAADKCRNAFFISGFIVKFLHLTYSFIKYLIGRCTPNNIRPIEGAHYHNELNKLRAKNTVAQISIFIILITGMLSTFANKHTVMCRFGEVSLLVDSFLSLVALRYFSTKIAIAEKNLNDWIGQNPAHFQDQDRHVVGEVIDEEDPRRRLLITKDN